MEAAPTARSEDRQATGVTIQRTWTEEARGFVFSTLAASYRRSSGLGDGGAFKASVLRPLENAIRDTRAELTLLHLDGSPDDFVGWSVVVGDALVFVYVKHAYRRRGFGRSLLKDGLTRVVYQTQAGRDLQRARYGRPLRPVPYLLMEGG